VLLHGGLVACGALSSAKVLTVLLCNALDCMWRCILCKALDSGADECA